MIKNNISSEFLEGLKEYEIGYDEIQDWEYCGSNKGLQLQYFVLKFPYKNIPYRAYNCVCGNNIIHNYYITDGDNIIILGDCCIKYFASKSVTTNTLVKNVCLTCGFKNRSGEDEDCYKCKLKYKEELKMSKKY